MTVTIRRRRFPVLVRKRDETVDPSEVHDLLAKNYPGATLGWVDDATWIRTRVRLADIKMARRPGGRDPEKVQGIADAIAAGRKMDPIVLVDTADGLELADGYHRTLAYQRAGVDQSVHNIDAYVGTGAGDHGPWEREMHDQKINKDDPGSGSVHIDDASGEIGVDAGDGKKRKRRKVSILKADEERRIVYGVVLEPDRMEGDTQGDVVSKEDIELAAHRYLYRREPIGDQHGQMAPPTVRPVESYIAPCDFELNGEPVLKGSWVLVAHVPDERLWEQVKKGEKAAWSVAGTGRRSPL